ncbi:MAG TPA: class I adenylate-forming enzyme family protein [Solirubrobacterales bacterium]|jgi:acyl-CoA synthetase (AMP-forming)/AMP-acid ligase II|nr:class I adenylate-forming enzyme family protein [Solirubrobacterales bacterium]
MTTQLESTDRDFGWSDADWPATTVHDALRRALERWGREHVAFEYVDEDARLTLGDLEDRSREWATALLGAGIEPGDRVAVALPGDSLWPSLQVAISLLGAIVVGVNTRYGRHELTQVLGSSEPRVVIATGNVAGWAFGDRLAPVLADLPRPPLTVIARGDAPLGVDLIARGDAPLGVDWVPAAEFLARSAGDAEALVARAAAVRPDDTALIQYTSGSTAEPKGVELTHDAMLTTAFEVMAAAGYEPGDVVYSALPFYHIGGSICTGPGALACGATMVVPRVYSDEGSVRDMVRLGCNCEQGHAAMFTMQIEAARKLGLLGDLRLRKGWIAAPPSTMRRIVDEFGMDGLVPVYGMSEYGLTTAGPLSDPVDARIEGIGLPVPGTEVRIAGDAGPRGPGEIQVRGRQLMTRYFGDPEATATALTEDGWFKSGDLASWGEDGRLHFAGRVKEMIKPGGENVSALEVEEFLIAHPSIDSVVVIGIADARLGEAPGAVVVLAVGESLELADLEAFCAERLARFKVPRALFVEAAMPMLANGKVDRALLARRYRDAG